MSPSEELVTLDKKHKKKKNKNYDEEKEEESKRFEIFPSLLFRVGNF